MSDEPHENHGYFALSDKGLVNSIVAHLSPTSGQNAAIAEMQRRQMEATDPSMQQPMRGYTSPQCRQQR